MKYSCDQFNYSSQSRPDLNKHTSEEHAGAEECRVTAKIIKLAAENIETEPVHVKYEPEPEVYDRTIKSEVLEEDSFVEPESHPYSLKYEPEPELVKYKPEFVHLRNEPEPEPDDYENSIKAEVIEEDPLAGL